MVDLGSAPYRRAGMARIAGKRRRDMLCRFTSLGQRPATIVTSRARGRRLNLGMIEGFRGGPARRRHVMTFITGVAGI